MDSNDSDYTVAMYADALEAWITALESGEYPQTTGMMCRLDASYQPVGYCCLGVFCEVAMAHGASITRIVMENEDEDDPQIDPHYLYNNNGGTYLPAEVGSWSGLCPLNGETLSVLAVDLGGMCAAQHNDDGKTFAQIVELLRKHVKPVPRPAARIAD